MKTMGVVFSNIYDNTLGELTNHRTVASLPFGGRYRQIDFILSNMSNSGIYNIGLITKYNYRSLMDHLGSCSEWDLNRKNEGLVIIPPFATGHTGIYKGKLEALYTAVDFIDKPDVDYVVVSDSTVLCNFDFKKAIDAHIDSGADITLIANKEVSNQEFSLAVKADKNGMASDIRVDTIPEKDALAGMGMFVFSKSLLVSAINETYSRGLWHLERDLIQRGFNEGKLKVGVYEFEGVVLRNNNIKNYFANNMSLLDEKIRKGIFSSRRPIYTKVRDEIPTYYGEGSKVSNSLLADGCSLYGNVKDSVLFRGVSVGKGSKINSSIIMQGAKIGENVTLDCVILDKNVTITDGTELKGTKNHPVIITKGEVV